METQELTPELLGKMDVYWRAANYLSVDQIYHLSHAFGVAFDNPHLIVACVIGDGEAETGPLATAWHSNKHRLVE